MCRGKEGIYFIPDVTKKGVHDLYCPLTAFNSQREVFRLVEQYQEELIIVANQQKGLFPLVLIYDHYQDLYNATEEKKLREEMEYFYATAIPEIRLIDKVKDTLMLYEGAYETYQKDPKLDRFMKSRGGNIYHYTSGHEQKNVRHRRNNYI